MKRLRATLYGITCAAVGAGVVGAVPMLLLDAGQFDQRYFWGVSLYFAPITLPLGGIVGLIVAGVLAPAHQHATLAPSPNSRTVPRRRFQTAIYGMTGFLLGALAVGWLPQLWLALELLRPSYTAIIPVLLIPVLLPLGGLFGLFVGLGLGTLRRESEGQELAQSGDAV